MSTKLTSLMETSKANFIPEKEKFLDTLADFIAENVSTITYGNYYKFTMMADRTDNKLYKYSFNTKEYDDGGDYTHEVITSISIESMCDILSSEFKIKLEQTGWVDRLPNFYHVKFYFA